MRRDAGSAVFCMGSVAPPLHTIRRPASASFPNRSMAPARRTPLARLVAPWIATPAQHSPRKSVSGARQHAFL